jgi:taurine--2-oxoglutarate transaminase
MGRPGHSWLDFSSQLVNVNIGHQHPKLVAAIQAQAARLCTIAPSFANDMRSEAARLITELAPGDLDMVFFTNGGTEAVENAVRMARGHNGRLKVLSTYRSYHGATGTSIGLTGDPRRWANEPTTPGAVKFWGPYLYRSAFHATTPAEECDRALEHLANVLMVEGPPRWPRSSLETVVGTNGIPCTAGWLSRGRAQALRPARHRVMMRRGHGGFGRCEWFAVDRWKVVPDLITFAKGSNWATSRLAAW